MIVASQSGYIAAAWLGTAALVGGYVLIVLRRGRTLSRQVPAEERRWS